MNKLIPVMTIPDLDECGSLDTNILMVDRIVKDKLVVNEFFDELRLSHLTVMLIDRYLVGLYKIEIFVLNLCTQNIGNGVSTETLIL